MRMITPTIIGDAMLTASSLAEDDYPEWSDVTAYVEDDYCIVAAEHSVYRALQANTDKTPLDAANIGVYWQYIGATNKWKPFDNKTQDKAEGTDEITYTFDGVGLTDGFAVLAVEAVSARLVVRAGDPLAVVYDETVSLTDTSVVIDGYTYYFEPLSYLETVIFEDLPPYTNATYELTISGTGTVKIGQIVLGRDYLIGTTVIGTSLGIEDFSRKERDSFGNAILVEGAFNKTVDFDVVIAKSSAGRVSRLLAGRRATPTLYYAGADTELYGTTVFGYFEDYNVLLSDQVESQVNIEVKELT